MQEYSRRAATAESRLEEIHKRSVHHDDHLRVVDAWWNQVGLFFRPSMLAFANFEQVLEEIELLVEGKVPAKSTSDGKIIDR